MGISTVPWCNHHVKLPILNLSRFLVHHQLLSAFLHPHRPVPIHPCLSSSPEILLLLFPSEDWFPCSLQVFPSPSLPLCFLKTQPSFQHVSRASTGSIHPNSRVPLFFCAATQDYPGTKVTLPVPWCHHHLLVSPGGIKEKRGALKLGLVNVSWAYFPLVVFNRFQVLPEWHKSSAPLWEGFYHPSWGKQTASLRDNFTTRCLFDACYDQLASIFL